MCLYWQLDLEEARADTAAAAAAKSLPQGSSMETSGLTGSGKKLSAKDKLRQKIAQLEQELAATKAEVATANRDADIARAASAETRRELGEVRLQLETAGNQNRAATGETTEQLKAANELAKLLSKPSQFTGSGSYVEWRTEVETYLQALQLPDSVQVTVAVGLLKGPALTWWKQHLTQKPKPISWDEMVTALNERFDHLNPELQARQKLQTLKQGNMSVHAYIKEFEGCIAHIPDLTEKDKVFRFLWGMRPTLKSKFAVDPTTHRMWVLFTDLIGYVTAYVADAAADADFINGLLDQAQEFRDAKGSGGSNGSGGSGGSKGHLKAKGGVHKKHGNGGKNANGNSGNKAGSSSPNKTFVNGKGLNVTRSKAVISYCHAKKLCISCYKPGHMVAACTENPVSGVPTGYTAN